MSNVESGPRTLNGSKHWLVLGAVLWAGLAAAQVPAQPPPAPAGGRPQPAQQPPPAGVPDEDFIEFLGEDDHGEGTWSDMVRKAQQQGTPAPQSPPSQGTKQS
jgi:hypothetical protein